MKDKSGKNITIGDNVTIPEPRPNDLWNYGNFDATVIAFKDDAECNAWDIEAERVKIS